VTVREAEELAGVARLDLAEGFDEALDHRAEQFVGVEVEGGTGEARIAAGEEGAAEDLQAGDGTLEEGSDNGLGGSAVGQLDQEPLDGGGGVIVRHGGIIPTGAESEIELWIRGPVHPSRSEGYGRGDARKEHEHAERNHWRGESA
jgi:hypothetical protein